MGNPCLSQGAKLSTMLLVRFSVFLLCILFLRLPADPQLFDEIQSIESDGDFGSKVQTLVRHLLYLQITEPGAKSIIFSAWADSLYSALRNFHVKLTNKRVTVVQIALQLNGKL